MLSTGHLLEVSRAGLLGSYVGQTAPMVTDAVSSAPGGVVIDQAYALTSAVRPAITGRRPSRPWSS